jgi:eukaryotic-like serine/threonine-protein kinase
MGVVLPSLPSIGDEIDRWIVIHEVACGGMAAVFAVRGARPVSPLPKVFAVKMILPHLATDRRFCEMFLDEARIAAHLEHPNVVSVLDVGEWRGLPYMVMEYLRGQPLSALRDAPRGVLLHVLSRAATGLHTAHETRGADGTPLGIVHRDVTPRNIHVGYDGHVRVVDFGLAAARGRITSTRTGELKGTLGYIAPEQLESGRRVDARADAWSIGVVAWELLAGRRLFDDGSESITLWNVINQRVEDLAVIVPDLDPDAAAIVGRCLRRKVSERPSSLSEVAEIFARSASAEGVRSHADVGAFMADRFARERDEEERAIHGLDSDPEIARTQGLESRDAPTRLLRRPSPLEARPEAERPTVLRSRPLSRGLVVGLASALGVAIAAWGASRIGDDHVDPLRSASAAPAQHDALTEARDAPRESSPPSRPQRELHLPVGGRVRLVLVNGLLHDERPVVVSIGQEDAAHVELILDDGTREQRTVTLEQDGRRLEAAHEPRSVGQIPRRSSKKRVVARDRALIGNPY